MVDASGLGTVCMKIKHKRDMDALFGALGGDSGLELIKDVTLGAGDNMDLIDAQKSLAMVNDKVISSQEEALEEFKKATGLVSDDGKFQKTVKLAFFNMAAVHDSVGSLSATLKKQDEDKKKKEADEAEKEAERLEAEQDARDIGNTSYYPSKRDWVEPVQAASSDERASDGRCVAGGAPKCVAVTDEMTIKRDKTRPDWRPITKYMLGEPDKRSGDFKVYIEEPEVVNSEKSKISVEFRSTSYSVRVETGSEPLVLGPVECGQLDLTCSSWRLSPGKRLTISLVKARTDAKLSRPGDPRGRAKEAASPAAAAAAAGKSADGDGAKKDDGSTSQILGVLLSFLPVVLSFWYFYVYKRGEGTADR